MKCNIILALCATALSGTSACVTTAAAFNPDKLPTAQLSRVTSICQSVLGLSPDERLIGGEWLNDDRLKYRTSHYRGCVTSLSDTLVHKLDSRASRAADTACRARGYTRGSPELALCVLDTPESASASQGAGGNGAYSKISLPIASGSFFYASGNEIAHREAAACAALGIDPVGPTFDSCVKSLDNTFFAIDNPIPD